jgi:hypothetical protein
MFLKGIGEYYCKILFYSRFKIGYYQIPVAKEDRPKTAFSFPGGGLWRFKRMPMRLSNSAPVFERLMEQVLTGLTWKTCLMCLC